MDDKQLIKKILERDDLAFGIFVEKYKKLVYTAIFRLVRDATDAEDIFQDVFLEVYRSIHYLRNESDLAGWLFKIAYNKSISFLRKKNPARANSTSYEDQKIESQKTYSIVDHQTPSQKLEDQEAEIVLYTAIDRLPEMQKKALLLHKFENYSHKEIGEMMELSISSVESLIYRAKIALRKSLYLYFKKHLN
ncbi:MAG: sigma-70 family RNA polymerase sigma factor [Prolixibacteraceae bacterium]|nr:sigma-70 family RNA polymerase sigma factor [Prolixibacteraceae bacterium]